MANPIVSGLLAAGKTAKAAKPFYSAVDQALNALPAKALPDQMLKELLKQPGVKLQEVIDRKLDKALGVPIVEKTRTVNLKKPDKEGNTVKQEKYFEVTPSPKGAKSISKADVEQVAKERSPSMPNETVLRQADVDDPYELVRHGDGYNIEAGGQRLYPDPLTQFEAYDELASMRANDIADAVDNTKFAQYVVPGGSNYREIVLSYPSSQVNGFRVGIKHPQTKPLNYDPEGVYATRAEAKAAMDAETARDPEFSKHYEVLPTYGKPSNYKSSHFPDVNNYLAHARVSDRVGPNGEKILHVEEIQSDLHQEGRKKGYKTQDIETRLKESEKEMQQIGLQIRGINNRMAASSDIDEFNKLANEKQALYDRQGFLGDEGNALIDKRAAAVPDAPFKKNWHELVMKRIMDDAVKGGYDKVVITPGAEQAKRYDLSKKVESINYEDEGGGNYFVDVRGKGQDSIIHRSMTTSELESHFGKEIAQKIINSEGESNGISRELSGLDLKVGGEGMKGFYDEMLPSYLNDYGKKYDAKVGSYNIPDPDIKANYSSYIPTVDDINRIGMQRFGVDRSGMTLDQIVEAENIFKQKISDDLSVNLHSFDITPQMRDEITTKGQSLYQAAPPVAIGAGLSQEESAPEPAPTYRRGGAVSQDAMNMAVWDHPIKREVGGEAEPTLEEMQAALTPYVGNFYTGKRAKKDTVQAYKAPLALARGWVAGTAGLPGDLEQLARTVGAVHSGAKKGTLYDETVDTTPFLPTSDFYKEYLPFKDNNPYSELLTDVGGLAGGMGSSQVGKAGVAVGKLGAEAINAGMQGEGLMGKVLAPVAPMNVIKQKGGNWIAGSVDQMLDPLKTKTAGGMDPAEALRELTEVYPPSQQNFSNLNPILKESVIRRTQWLEKNAALNSFVDKQMTRYIKNEMSTPEDPIRLMAEAWPAQQAKLLESKQVQIDKAVSDMEKARQSRGFTPEMMTSSQARIRDLEKEKELIERQVGLHTDPEQLNIRPDMLVDKFLQQGQKILGKSPTAKAWEGASDLTVNSQIAKDYLDARSPTNAFFGTGNQISATNKALKENPWLSKVDPMTPVYYQQGYIDDIKFDHIIDELRNATNPASGLPKSLQIEAKDLAKYSMPQAVERVDKINAWRASQKAEVDTNRANNAATFTVKEYPDGVSWKELKLPEVPTELPSQYEIVGDLNSGFKYRRKTPDRYGSTQESPPFDTAEEAQKAALSSKSVRSASLEDALAYEGELAKHCVGGYCPDVESGKSQVFSLRDKGVPQVTIEVKPQTAESYYNSLPSNERHELLDKAIAYQKEDYLPGVMTDAPERLQEQTVQALANYVKAQGIELLPAIAQIRGINNRAPAEKYLPMVHDFVKSGKWSDVSDLRNIGMLKSENGYITDAEAALIKKEKGLKRGGVVSQDAMQFAVMDKQLRKRNG